MVLIDLWVKREGRNSANFNRYKNKNLEQIEVSFSIVTGKRNLDLEAGCVEEKRKFIQSLRLIMQRNKIEVDNKESGLTLRKLITQEYVKSLSNIKMN